MAKCPECGQFMVMRTNRLNGSEFWGCSRFPHCRGTREKETAPPDEFAITMDWLNRDAVGPAVTREILSLLGKRWPPRKGWKEQLIGKRISLHVKEKIERINRERPKSKREIDALQPQVTVGTDKICHHCQTTDAPKLFFEEGEWFCAGCLTRHFAKKIPDSA